VGAVIYKCKPGEHNWQPEERHEDDAGRIVSERLFCSKCPAWKEKGEPDPVSNVIYKCKPGKHDWQPGKTYFAPNGVAVGRRLMCTKCDANKFPGTEDPKPENYAPDAYVWID
jgi:hypothetical protein